MDILYTRIIYILWMWIADPHVQKLDLNQTAKSQGSYFKFEPVNLYICILYHNAVMCYSSSVPPNLVYNSIKRFERFLVKLAGSRLDIMTTIKKHIL